MAELTSAVSIALALLFLVMLLHNLYLLAVAVRRLHQMKRMRQLERIQHQLENESFEEDDCE